MKKTFTASTLLLLFALSIFAATPQQPIPPEKKSAMHKLDPVDIFPQVRERSGKESKRNNRALKNSSGSTSSQLADNSSAPTSRAGSRKNSRRRHSSEEDSPAALIASATPTPSIENPGAQPLPTTTASPVATPNSSLSLAETNSKKSDSSPQTLASLGNLPDGEGGVRNHLLSLPIILALLVIVLIALVLVFAKLVRYLRGPAV